MKSSTYQKSPLKQEIVSGPQLNINTGTSENILWSNSIASKKGPLTRIEKQAMS